MDFFSKSIFFPEDNITLEFVGLDICGRGFKKTEAYINSVYVLLFSVENTIEETKM